MEEVQTATNQGRVADALNRHWVYRLLPKSIWPYAQLARWDRPIGWQLLLWPCLWSSTLASQSEGSLPDLWQLMLFAIGAIAMRGAGCTYNDIIDVKIDAKVGRTRSRPLPSGQVCKRAAWLFLIGQALAGFAVLIQFNWFSIWLGLASLGVVAAYPFMKRMTDWPQLVLGLAFSWGALMGWAGIYGSLSLAPVLLYASTVLWVIGYDTIYAHQDREDDALVGVRSTARLFGTQTKSALMVLYCGMVALLIAAFFVANVAVLAYLGVAAVALHLTLQIAKLDIDDPVACLALFKSNTLVGWLIVASLLASALFKIDFALPG